MAKKPKIETSHLSPDGGERLARSPIAVPLRLRRQPSLAERIRHMVRHEQFQADRESAGEETFEEADDFEVGDDYDPHSPYEELFDGEFEYQAELRREAKKEETLKARKRRSGARKPAEAPPPAPPSEGTPVKPGPRPASPDDHS